MELEAHVNVKVTCTAGLPFTRYIEARKAQVEVDSRLAAARELVDELEQASITAFRAFDDARHAVCAYLDGFAL